MTIPGPIQYQHPLNSELLPGYKEKYFDSLLYYHYGWQDTDPVTTLSFNLAGGWTAAEKALFRQAFASFEAVANIDFVETAFASQANFLETKRQLPPGVLGQHGLPWVATNNGNVYQVPGWFDPEELTKGGLSVGSYGYNTLVHELAHGLGMHHPHVGFEVNGTGFYDKFPGVTKIGPDNYSYGQYNLNQGIYTVMSYNLGWEQVQNLAARKIYNYGYAAGPMALDIAALQFAYGANYQHKKGNDVYTLTDANRSGTAWRCIWDGGGIDTIVYNGARTSRIDLRDATIDASPTGGGVLSYANGILGGFTIANGVHIENATGGNGNDRLTGNEIANVLLGRGGHDVLLGGENFRQIQIGFGGSTGEVDNNSSRARAQDVSWASYSYGNNADIADATTIPHLTVIGSGDGTVEHFKLTIGGPTTLTLDIDHAFQAAGLSFDSVVRILNASGAELGFNDDAPELDPGSDSVLDSALTLFINTPGVYYIEVGALQGVGLPPSPIPVGADYELHISSYGFDGTDRLDGGAGNDTLYGQGGHDRLIGGVGNDTLVGGMGNDIMTGSAGYDTFVFNTDPMGGLSEVVNRDVITDFNPLHDTIRMENGIFTSLAAGALRQSQFRVGSQALDGNDFIIYDRSTGKLSYDPDGAGFRFPEVFVVLSNRPALGFADIFVV